MRATRVPPFRSARVTSGKRRPRSSLTQNVYDQLRADIITGALEPGSNTSEAELATRFKISKTPVREALAALRQEGFVKTFPRRGYQIVPISFGNMHDLFDVRLIVEAGAAELAAQRITEAEITHLNELADVVYDAEKRSSLEHFVAANREFHAAIAKASRNEPLYELVMRQIESLERYFYLGARLRDVSAETKSDHHKIVKALKARDPLAVRNLVIRHVNLTRQGLFEALASTSSASKVRL